MWQPRVLAGPADVWGSVREDGAPGPVTLVPVLPVLEAHLFFRTAACRDHEETENKEGN